MTETLPLIYRDEYIVAINKPGGLLVHRSEIDRHETRFAVTETLAHLEYWRFRGKLGRTGHTPWLYQPA